MGLQVMRSIIDVEAPSPAAKAVLLVLAYHANDRYGRCNPSVRTIARETCLSIRQVIRVLATLEECGLIDAHRSRGRISHYAIRTPQTSDTMSPVAKNDCGHDVTTLVTPCHHPSDTMSPVVVTPCHPNKNGTRKELEANNSADSTSRDNSGAQDLLDWLNAVCGAKFRLTAQRRALIDETLAEHDYDDVCRAVEWKAQEWTGTRFGQYLTPERLLRPDVLEATIQAARRGDPTRDRDDVSRTDIIDEVERANDERLAALHPETHRAAD